MDQRLSPDLTMYVELELEGEVVFVLDVLVDVEEPSLITIF
jgi:hypothetical protein